MTKKPKDNSKAEAVILRGLLHGVLNGDVKAEQAAREILYGKPGE